VNKGDPTRAFLQEALLVAVASGEIFA